MATQPEGGSGSRLSLHGRLVLISFLFLSVSLILVTILTCMASVGTLRSKDNEVSAGYVLAIRKSIHSLVSDAVASSTYLLSDPELRLLYAEFEGAFTPRGVIDELSRRIDEAFLMIRQDLMEITILTENHPFARGNTIPFDYADLVASSAFSELRQRPGSYILLAQTWTDDAPTGLRDAFYYAGMVEESDRRVIVILKVKPDVVLLRQSSPAVAITDLNGRLLWTQSTDLGRLLADEVALENSQLYGEIELPGIPHAKSLYYSVSQENAQIYFGLIDKSQLRSDEARIIRFSGALALVVLCVFVLLSVPGCGLLIRPVKRLSDALHQIGTFGAPDVALRASLRTFGVGARVRFKSRLIVFFGVLVAVSAALCVAVSLWYAEGIIENQIETTVTQTMIQTGLDVELTLANLERNSAYLAVYAPFQEALENDSWSADLSQNLNTILVNQSLFAEGLTAVDVYDRHGLLRYSTRPFGGYGGLDRTQVDRLADSVPGAAWMASQRGIGKSFVIPLVRRVRSIDSMTPLGTIVFDLSESAVADKVSSGAIAERGLSFVVNAAGEILSAEDKTVIGTPVQDIVKPDVTRSSSRPTDQVYESDRFAFFSIPLRDRMWDLVFLVPREYMSADWRRIFLSNISVVLMVIVILIVSVRGVSSRVVRPIETLMSRAKTVGLCDLEGPGSHVSSDEIGQLAGAFDDMLQRLHTLLQEVYVHEIKEKELETRQHEAQLRSLQYQINPHFLYNTFASIKFLVKLGEQEQAIRMLTTLGKLFQRTVRSEQIIPVADEVGHARAYLQIERERYQQRLDVHWHIPQELLGYRTLKFILQPVVENAVVHGIRTSVARCEVRIEGELLDTRIRFSVHDNGAGMDHAQLTRLRAIVEGNGSGEHAETEPIGIGLANVQERIHLIFGDQYGLRIESEEGQGTKVWIDVPVLEDTRDAREEDVSTPVGR